MDEWKLVEIVRLGSSDMPNLSCEFLVLGSCTVAGRCQRAQLFARGLDRRGLVEEEDGVALHLGHEVGVAHGHLEVGVAEESWMAWRETPRVARWEAKV